MQELTAEFIHLLPQLSIALIVIGATCILARFARRFAERLLGRTELRGTLVNLFETLIGVLIWVVGLLISASIVFPGVAYDVDLDGARDVIAKAVKGCTTVQDDQKVEVYAKEFGDSSINFLLRWWAGSKPVDVACEPRRSGPRDQARA